MLFMKINYIRAGCASVRAEKTKMIMFSVGGGENVFKELLKIYIRTAPRKHHERL